METPIQPSENEIVTNDSTKKPKRKDKDDKEEKPFRCVGFGDCSMAFTRQEHLNRHKRRHTGEVKMKKKVRFIFTHYSSQKPFPCIVEGCTLRFSRNDNMRQHAERCPCRNPDSEGTKRKRSAKGQPRPTGRKRKLAPRSNPERASKKGKSYHEDDEYEEGSQEEQLKAPLVLQNGSSSSTDTEMSPSPGPIEPSPYRNRVRTAPRILFCSYGRNDQEIDFQAMVQNFSLFAPRNAKPTRRLSLQELASSIDRLEEISSSSSSEEDSNAVGITEDEYETLIAIRELHRTPYVRE